MRTSPASAKISDPGSSQDEPRLGDYLRQLRFKRKLSLSQVSSLTGVSKSTLSRVESNRLSLTYDKLMQLCRGLGVDLATLLNDWQQSIQGMTRLTSTGPGSGRSVRVNLVTYDYLCTHLSGKKMTPVLTEIHSKTLAETNGFLKHEGEEFVYVLQGTLQLHTEFYEPLVLDTGASVYFDSTMGHTYVSVGEKPLKILSVMSSSPNLLFNTESDAQPVDAGAKAGVTPSKPQSRGRRIRAARSHEKH